MYANCFSFWGPPDPTGALPLDPSGRLPSPGPLTYDPKEDSWRRHCGSFQFVSSTGASSSPFNPFTADPVKALHFAVLV